MTDSNILLDSSAWLRFLDSKQDSQITEFLKGNSRIHTSVLTLFEIKRKMIKAKDQDEFIRKTLEFIKNTSITIEINDTIAVTAAEYAEKFKLPAADSLIYATAKLNLCTLITFDNDFRNLENVKVLKGVE